MMPSTNARELLTKIGIGQFNATMVIPYLWIAPATTDPKSPQIILMVQKIQRQLNQLGANIAETGYLDLPTASALSLVVGDRWMTSPWSWTIQAVLSAKASGLSIAPAPIVSSSAPGPESMGAFGLPDVPGGLVTYGVAAFLLYRHFKKKR